MEEIKYITPDNCKFNKTAGGFLSLKIGEAEYKRVGLYRAFPFSHKDLYISVKDEEENEIGIIEDLNSFDDHTYELFREELDRRYFLPEILKIISLKDEFNYFHFKVTTNLGDREFNAKKVNSNFISLNDNSILIVDVDGNRYKVNDYTNLDRKSYKYIELMI